MSLLAWFRVFWLQLLIIIFKQREHRKMLLREETVGGISRGVVRGSVNMPLGVPSWQIYVCGGPRFHSCLDGTGVTKPRHRTLAGHGVPLSWFSALGARREASTLLQMRCWGHAAWQLVLACFNPPPPPNISHGIVGSKLCKCVFADCPTTNKLNCLLTGTRIMLIASENRNWNEDICQVHLYMYLVPTCTSCMPNIPNARYWSVWLIVGENVY